MLIALNMSREVFDYFKGYDLTEIVNCLLEQYDFTSMPPTSGKREIERQVNVTDPVYIQLYNTVGPRSKKVSLGRLLEFAYNTDVLANPNFKVKPTGNTDDPTYGLLNSAYNNMLRAQKYCDRAELRMATEVVYNLKEVIKNANTDSSNKRPSDG